MSRDAHETTFSEEHGTGAFASRCAELVCRGRGVFLALALLLSIGSALLVLTRLQVEAERNALVNEELEYNRRWHQFQEEFGDLQHLIAMIGVAREDANSVPALPTRAERRRMKALASELADRLRAEPDYFYSIMERVEPEQVAEVGLLYLPYQQLEQVCRQVKEALPTFQALSEERSLGSLFDSFSGQFEEATEPRNEAEERARREQLDGLTTMLRACRRAAGESFPQAPPHPEELLGGFSGSASYDPDGYLFTSDGKYLLVLIRVRREPECLSPFEEPLRKATRIKNELEPRYPELQLGLTGRPAIYAAEMASSQRDMARAAGLSFVAVGILFITFFRSLLRPLLAVLCLGLSILWTFGFAAAAIGHLNIFAMVFAIVLIALGVDFGIHFLMHYARGVRATGQARDGIRTAYADGGKALLIGGFTTAAAFGAVAFTDFRGLVELGIICGAGLVLSLIAMMIVLPALLTLADRRPAPPQKKHSGKSPDIAVEGKSSQSFLPGRGAARFGLLLLPLGLPAAFIGRRIDFNYNLLELQDPHSEAVAWEHRLVHSDNRSSWCATVTRERKELERRRTELLERAGQVRATEALYPQDEEAKRRLLAELRSEWAAEPFAPPEPNVDVRRLRRAIGHLRQEIRLARDRSSEAREFLAAVQGELDGLYRVLKEGNGEKNSRNLHQFEEHFFDELDRQTSLLRRGLDPPALQAALLPLSMREWFIGKQGKLALYAYPAKDVWEWDNLEEFVGAMREVDPHTVGVPVQIYESGLLLVRGFRESAAIAFAVIIAILIATQRSVKAILATLAPLVLAIMLLVGVMELIGLRFNFANFFAVPILIGTSVDHGVHLVHAARKGQPIAWRGVRRAVTLCALTTAIGFGSLLTAQHRGLWSLGAVLALGALLALLAAQAFVPSLLALWRSPESKPAAKPKGPG